MGRGWVNAVREASGAKKGKLFTKIAKEITVAVKVGGGASPDNNARLRAALKEAQKNSMPKDTVERAIKRGTGAEGGADFEEITYEAMGPHAVAVLVECLTDNRNRTVQDLRATLVRNQGQMGESGSVMWSFDRIGSLIAKPKKQGLDPEEAAINCEANEVEAIGDGSFQFICNPTDLAKVETAMEESGDWDVLKAELSYRAKNPVDLSESQEADLKKFIDAIEDSDDVKRVHLAI